MLFIRLYDPHASSFKRKSRLRACAPFFHSRVPVVWRAPVRESCRSLLSFAGSVSFSLSLFLSFFALQLFFSTAGHCKHRLYSDGYTGAYRDANHHRARESLSHNGALGVDPDDFRESRDTFYYYCYYFLEDNRQQRPEAGRCAKEMPVLLLLRARVDDLRLCSTQPNIYGGLFRAAGRSFHLFPAARQAPVIVADESCCVFLPPVRLRVSFSASPDADEAEPRIGASVMSGYLFVGGHCFPPSLSL